MVLDDVYNAGRTPVSVDPVALNAPLEISALAAPLDRMASAIADSVFLAPVATLAMSPFRRQAMVAQLTAAHGDWMTAAVGATVALALVFVAYQVCFVAWLGATPGQRLFGLRVVSVWNGQKPKVSTAVARAFFFLLEILLLGTPWLAVFANAKRRSLHDKVADTVVVAGAGRRVVGAPSQVEAGAAAGVGTALIVIALAVGGSAWREFSRELRETDASARELEDRGLLCASAAELREEWPVGQRPGRLEAALVLTALGAIDSDCLNREAEREAWRDFGGRALAYAAQSVARQEDAELSARYADKACSLEPGGDACLLARVGALSAGRSFEGSAGADRLLAARLASGNKAGQPVYLIALAVRRRMEMKDHMGALALMNDLPASRVLAASVSALRAKALWSIGRDVEARAIMDTSYAAADSAQRAQLARQGCESELERGCSAEAKLRCGPFTESIKQAAEPLTDLDSTVAFVRADQCALGATWNAKAAKALIGPAEGREYVEAVARAQVSGRVEGRKALLALLARAEPDDAVYLDVQTRLAESAVSVNEADIVRVAWEKSGESDAWRSLGLVLVHRFLALGSPRKALTTGLRLRASDPSQIELARTLIVAAHKAGDLTTALSLLRDLDRVTEVGSGSGRAPASASDFDRVARDLRTRSEERKGSGVGP